MRAAQQCRDRHDRQEQDERADRRDGIGAHRRNAARQDLRADQRADHAAHLADRRGPAARARADRARIIEGELADDGGVAAADQHALHDDDREQNRPRNPFHADGDRQRHDEQGADRREFKAVTLRDAHDHDAGNGAKQAADCRDVGGRFPRDVHALQHDRPEGGLEEDAQRARAVADPDDRRQPAQAAGEEVTQTEGALLPGFVGKNEAVVALDVDGGIESLERRGDLVRPDALAGEEAWRLGQEDGDQEGANDRAHTGDEIDAFPPMVRRDHVRERPGEGAADAEAHHDEGDNRRAQLLGYELDIERPGERQRAADGEPIEEAQREQGRIPGREAGEEGEDAEGRRAQDDRGTTADLVTHIGEDEAAHDHAQRARREGIADLHVGQAQLVLHIGGGESHHHHVEAIEHGDEPGEGDQEIIERRELPAFQQRRQIDYASRSRHCSILPLHAGNACRSGAGLQAGPPLGYSVRHICSND